MSKINNTDLLARNPGVRVVHVRPNISGMKVMTIAFRQPHKGANIEISTAIKNPHDRDFNRKIGTRCAVENFERGRVTLVPDFAHDPIISIRAMFGQLPDDTER